MLYLLDSDHFSLIYRKTPEGAKIQARLHGLSNDDYGISIVTYAEATKGWLANIADVRTPAEEVTAFDRLQKNLRFCTLFAIWDYTVEAAVLCAEWKTKKIRVGTQDMRIAAISHANHATLLTRNTRDFTRIPGLVFEDWTT